MSTHLPLRCQSCGFASHARAGICLLGDARTEAGSTIIEQGQIPERVVLLRRGKVVLSSHAESGRELSCAVRGSDSLLGLESVLHRPVPYEVRALTDVALCFVDAASFKTWIGPLDSPLGTVLRYSLEEMLRRASERQAVEGTALRRVARFLLQTTETDGEPLTVPQGVLASVLGMRPETLSRALADLKASGALAPGRKIGVKDLERLRVAAEV